MRVMRRGDVYRISRTCNTIPKTTTIFLVSQRQDELYQEASVAYGDALDRLVRGYEFDVDKRADLLQDIHLALWRSFEKFEARCSIRTWVYRIAHNIATSHVIRQRRAKRGSLLSLDDLESISPPQGTLNAVHDRMDIERLLQFSPSVRIRENTLSGTLATDSNPLTHLALRESLRGSGNVTLVGF